MSRTQNLKLVKKIFYLFLVIVSFSYLYLFSARTSLKVHAQNCNAPATATGVEVSYPGCEGDGTGAQCSWDKAKCKWNSQADAVSFNVTVTEVESGNVIKNNESVISSSNSAIFPITQGKTYKCDVVAVSSCGRLALAASDTQLCVNDAIIATPTATLIPTAVPTTPIIPTITQQPGGVLQTVAITGGIVLAIVGGIILFIL